MYETPKPGPYRRLKDGAIVQVTNCTGSTGFSEVAVQGARLSHVRLENFWRKYQPATDETRVDQ